MDTNNLDPLELKNISKKIESTSRGYVAPISIMNAVSKAIECNNFEDGVLAEKTLFEGKLVSSIILTILNN